MARFPAIPDKDIQAMRELRLKGASLAEVAMRFNVRPETVSRYTSARMRATAHHSAASISSDQIVAIREVYNRGMSVQAIAMLFGLNHQSALALVKHARRAEFARILSQLRCYGLLPERRSRRT